MQPHVIDSILNTFYADQAIIFKGKAYLHEFTANVQYRDKLTCKMVGRQKNMIKLTEIPNIGKEFLKIREKYVEYSADPRKTIPLVEEFLLKYPYYPEAYNFLAVLFIADSQLSNAMKCIKAIQKIDPWRLHGLFDKAEILILREKTDEGINALIEAVRLYTDELFLDLDNFIISSEPVNKEKLKKLIVSAVFDYLNSNDGDETVFENLKEAVSGWKFEFLK